MKKTKGSRTLAGSIAIGLAGTAVGMSIFGATIASAIDIPVIATVLEPSPTSTPKTFVDLPVGEPSESAPEVIIQLTGLEPYSFVQIFAQSEPILIASGFADKFGVFKVKAQLPPSLEAGDHSIVANAQKLGDPAPTIATLIKFAVSDSGTVQKSSSAGGGNSGGSNNGGSSGGGTGSGENGGSGGSTQPTPSPSASASAGAGSDLSRGVVQVSGVSAQSRPSINPLGEPAQVQVTLQNHYSKTIPVTVNVEIANFLGMPVAETSHKGDFNLVAGASETLSLSSSTLGQWGFYSARVTVAPRGKVGGVLLQPMVREVSFFVLPVWPTVFLFSAIIFEIVRSLNRSFLLKRRFSNILGASMLEGEPGE